MAVGGTKVNPKKFRANQIPIYLYSIPIAVFMGLPIVFIICHAFKPVNELFAFPPKIFVSNPTFENFKRLFNYASSGSIPFSRYIFNSLISTGSIVILSILISTMAGFALSKFRFRRKENIMTINNLALMFVATAVTIPRYLVISVLGIENTYLAHILPVIAMPVGLFLVKQFIDQVPNELLEAAQMEGAGPWQIYRKIILPMIRPAVMTCAILAFQSAWGNTETSSLFTTTDSIRTLAFYMSTLSTDTIQGTGMTAAAGLIMFIPNLLLFIVMQSNVMNTMARSGLK
ncbi:MAG: carbohydrate ABC transporter permease [Clostridia bacterium]|nr:carbohydrate ABC transporter permease [Clostridia bacterium]